MKDSHGIRRELAEARAIGTQNVAVLEAQYHEAVRLETAIKVADTRADANVEHANEEADRLHDEVEDEHEDEQEDEFDDTLMPAAPLPMP